jgi:hypothetical protein
MSLSSAGLEATEVNGTPDTDQIRDYDELDSQETRAFHRLLDGQRVRKRALIDSLSDTVVRFTAYYRIERR